MATLLEILKAQGATDADLEAMKPLLGNAKFASAIESEIAAKDALAREAAEAKGKLSDFESQRNQFEVQATEAKKRVEEYDNWYNNQITPALAKIQQDSVSASAAAAAETARYKTALAKAQETYGFEIPLDAPANVPTVSATAPASPGGNVAIPTAQPTIDTSKFATADDLNARTDMFGQALTSQSDLLMEHMSLFGTNKPVNFEQLRTKAIAEKRPLREIWERELHVPERRQELVAVEQAKKDAEWAAKLEAARQEGRQEAMSHSLNPLTQPGQAGSSKFGMTAAFKPGAFSQAKPWESQNQRDQARFEKVIGHLAKTGVA